MQCKLPPLMGLLSMSPEVESYKRIASPTTAIVVVPSVII